MKANSDNFSAYSVMNYLHADLIINGLEKKKSYIEHWPNRITLTAHLEWEPLAARKFRGADEVTQGSLFINSLDLERKICEIDTACNLIDQRIARWQMREQLFNEFLGGLTQQKVRLIHQGIYETDLGLNDELQEEIWQIETYVAFHFGFPPPAERVSLTSSTRENVKHLSEYFEGIRTDD